MRNGCEMAQTRSASRAPLRSPSGRTTSKQAIIALHVRLGTTCVKATRVYGVAEVRERSTKEGDDRETQADDDDGLL